MTIVIYLNDFRSSFPTVRNLNTGTAFYLSQLEKVSTMNWVILIIAGLFEVGFTTCLKLSNNFTKLGWSIGFFISISLSFFLLNKASQTIPIGTAYSVWTGIGAVGTAIVGIILFREPSDFWRLFFITTLIASIAGLKFIST
jgi:quaternary ammonium compound-resistance protein SugE